MEEDPVKPEDDPQPEPETPRFLLPDGCKDLIDAMRARANQERATEQSTPAASSSGDDSSQTKPVFVTLTDPVTVRELAAALHLPPFHIIGSLMELNVFASVNQSIRFEIAWGVCARLGVVAFKAK